MNEQGRVLSKLITKSGYDLGFSLQTQAFLVQQYSNDPDNPNVSAYLRSGAIEMIGRTEDEAYNAALDELLGLLAAAPAQIERADIESAVEGLRR